MATELNKKLIRLSTEKVGTKQIVVILNNEQTIELKLKGSRGTGKSISIIGLYEQLYDIVIQKDKSNTSTGSLSITTQKPKKGDNKMISLYDLRSHNAISLLPIDDVAKFDAIIKSVIESTT